MDQDRGKLTSRQQIMRGLAGLAVVLLGYVAISNPTPATIGVFLGAVVALLRLYD